MKFNADKQFIPTKEKIAKIAKMFGKDCDSFTLAKSGIENCAIIVTAADKAQYVIRVYRQDRKSDEAILLEADFVNYLSKNGIRVANIFPNLEESLLTHFDDEVGRWQVIMMPFFEGGHTGSYSPAFIDDMARTQARMHLLAADYQGSMLSVKKVTEVYGSRYTDPIDFSAIEYPLQREILTRASQYSKELNIDLPRGLCHRDYDEGNILAHNNTITAVLDFDDLADAPFVLCLSYTLWDIFYSEGETAIDQYLQSYEQIRPLTDLERSYIWPIMLFRHYKIIAIWTLMGDMDNETVDTYIEVEKQLLLKQV